MCSFTWYAQGICVNRTLQATQPRSSHFYYMGLGCPDILLSSYHLELKWIIPNLLKWRFFFLLLFLVSLVTQVLSFIAFVPQKALFALVNRKWLSFNFTTVVALGVNIQKERESCKSHGLSRLLLTGFNRWTTFTLTRLYFLLSKELPIRLLTQ